MNYAIIIAAGSGTRFGCDKMLVDLDNKPLILHAVESFVASDINHLIIVASNNNINEIKSLISKYNFDFPVILGGNTRSQSVFNGLKAVPTNCNIVAIADGARPFVSVSLINKCLHQASLHGSAIPYIAVTDTIYSQVQLANETVSQYFTALNRNMLKAVQTPQAFDYKSILLAYQQNLNNNFTDDSQIYYKQFANLNFIDGETTNIKITYPADLKFRPNILTDNTIHNTDLKNKAHSDTPNSAVANNTANILLNTANIYTTDINDNLNANTKYRIGNGVDFHNFVAGRKLILGGVEIPYHLGLQGHSDADAFTHAIMDSLLSSINQRDIGIHFPDTDEKYANINSLILLGHVRDLLQANKASINNISACIIADKPKLSSYIPQMSQNIASVLNINATKISITATTTEGTNPNCIQVQAYCIVTIDK